jgi:RNA polymerase-binding transcription factor DksA
MEAAMSSITLTNPAQHTDLAGHLPELRRLLEEHRRFRLDQLAQFTSEAPGAGSKVDSLDQGADIARVEVSAAVEAAAHHALDDIDAALARMTAGRYGDCARCHADIPVERLFAVPQASLCVRCQQRAEYRR